MEWDDGGDARDCMETMLDEFGLDAVVSYCRLVAWKCHWTHDSKPVVNSDRERAAWYAGYAKGLVNGFKKGSQ